MLTAPTTWRCRSPKTNASRRRALFIPKGLSRYRGSVQALTQSVVVCAYSLALSRRRARPHEDYHDCACSSESELASRAAAHRANTGRKLVAALLAGSCVDHICSPGVHLARPDTGMMYVHAAVRGSGLRATLPAGPVRGCHDQHWGL
jgi:hypothetical protein